jgi:hypothetical protein
VVAFVVGSLNAPSAAIRQGVENHPDNIGVMVVGRDRGSSRWRQPQCSATAINRDGNRWKETKHEATHPEGCEADTQITSEVGSTTKVPASGPMNHGPRSTVIDVTKQWEITDDRWPRFFSEVF